MAADKTLIYMPQQMTNHQGGPRHIGVELEMSGLSIDELAQEVASELQLSVDKTSRYQYTLQGDNDGEWLVELDFQLLKKMGQEERAENDIGNDIETLLKLVSKPLVPHELVSPPLKLERLTEVQTLTERLRNAGAKGTSESVFNAFSMQLNPEIPSLDSRVLTAYLKAFLCLYDWLYEEASINMTRRITTYVDPFPKHYVRKVLAPDYWPQDTDTLIRDYLLDNPTRNRALDMLPLFSYLNADLVEQYTKDPLIKARPAFHYRLPNCEIHLANWGVHLAWDGWLQVEALAQDSKRLNACAKAYLRALETPWWKRLLTHKVLPWHQQLRSRWLVNLGLPKPQ